MTRRQHTALVLIALVAVLVALAVPALADEQSATDARFEAGVAMSVAESEKGQAIERADGIPLYQDANFVSGDYHFSNGEMWEDWGEIAWQAGNWGVAEAFFGDAIREYVQATMYYELAFP